MNPRGRQICGGLAVALVVLMLWLFRSSPDIEFAKYKDVAAFSIECDPLIESWALTFDAPDADQTNNGFGHDGYDVVSGEPPEPDRAFPNADQEMDQQLAHFCTDARTGRAGLIGLVAFPAALLAAIAIIRFPREIRISRTVTAPARTTPDDT